MGFQDQHGARNPSSRADWPRTAAAASSGPGRDSAVASATSGVMSVIAREITGCEVPKISAITSSVTLCRM